MVSVITVVNTKHSWLFVNFVLFSYPCLLPCERPEESEVLVLKVMVG